MKRSAKLWMLLLTILLIMQGCGGGGGSSDSPNTTDNPLDTTSDGYSGSEDQAVVSDSNAKDLAVSAASGVKQAVDENGITLPFQTAARASKSYSIDQILGFAETPQDVSADLCPQGGEAIVETIEEYTDSWLNVFVFDNCAQNEGIYAHVITGTVRHTYSKTSSAFTDVYSVSVSYSDGSTKEINKTISCESVFNCSAISEFLGYDGRQYQETDVAVTEVTASTYSVSGRVYDPTHGYIDVTTEIPFTLNCPNDRPGAGRLSFAGANQTSGSIEFISCDEYVVTTSSGTATTYSW
ncbi:MAG: hypothetical protein ABW098_17735 [Candidatus Thiodiazotropha sp.]